MLYLDNAATSARKPFCVYSSLIYNTLFNSFNAGHGGHGCAMKALGGVLDAQDKLSALFNVPDPQNIAFCQNATHALNEAILGTVSEGGHIVITGLEHNSVLRPVHTHKNYTVADCGADAHTDPEAIREAIRENTELIICGHVSNVCGSIQDIEAIGRIAEEKNIPFLVDASQSAGHIEVDVQKQHISLLAFSGHKGLMGPLGTGGLYVKDPKKLRPVFTGGTGSMSKSLTQPQNMPDMLHSGTLNAPAIAALGKGAEFVRRHGINEIARHEKELCDNFIQGLKNMGRITVYGGAPHSGVCAFNIEDIPCYEVSQRLEKEFGIITRSGTHCAPLAHKALGTGDTGSVRVSFGFFNTRRDCEKALDAVFKIRKTA